LVAFLPLFKSLQWRTQVIEVQHLQNATVVSRRSTIGVPSTADFGFGPNGAGKTDHAHPDGYMPAMKESRSLDSMCSISLSKPNGGPVLRKPARSTLK
jgi:hypothetical protein